MLQLVVSQRFKKNLRNFLRKHPDLKDAVQGKLAILQINPAASQLRTHPLTGKLKGCFALSITYEYRLVFSVDTESIYLLAIGTHDEVY